MDMRHGVEIVCANAINTICPGKTVHFQIEKKLVSQKSSLANFWIWKYCLSPDMEIVFETFWRLSPGEGDLGKKLDLKLTLKLFEYEVFGGETSAKYVVKSSEGRSVQKKQFPSRGSPVCHSNSI